MGHGIAQVFAQSGFSVILSDSSEEILRLAFTKVKTNLSRQVEKGILRQKEAERIADLIFISADLNSMQEADLILEAVPESLEIKRKVFQQLDTLAKAEAVFASNTSSLSITKLASFTNRPSRFLGIHFMNPPPVMKLVEIVRGSYTSEEVVGMIQGLCEKLGKTAVESKDSPGFLANRILMPMIHEAIFTLQEGVGTKEAIDTVMRLGMNHPMGPLELADFIGLDVCLSILEVLEKGFQDPKYRPCFLLRQMVESGFLGRKTKQGFYKY